MSRQKQCSLNSISIQLFIMITSTDECSDIEIIFVTCIQYDAGMGSLILDTFMI